MLQNKIHIPTTNLKSIDINSKDVNYKTYKTEVLSIKNLLKTISKKIEIKISKRLSVNKLAIDHRIFLKLYSYMRPNSQNLSEFFNNF